MVEPQEIYAVLAEVVENEQVLRDPDLRWYDLGLVDSLRTVEILVALETAFGVDIAPTEIDHAAWATPRLVMQCVLDRVTIGRG